MSLPPVRALVDHEVDRPQLQAPRGVQASGTNSPSSCFPIRTPRGGRSREEDVSRTTLCGRQGAREVPDGKRRGRPARARPRRRGLPDPIPNSAAKPAIAQSTAEPVRGRTGRRARAGRVRPREGQGARRGRKAPSALPGGLAAPFAFFHVELQASTGFLHA